METNSDRTAPTDQQCWLAKSWRSTVCYYQAYSTKLSSGNFCKFASRMLSETVTHVTVPSYSASRAIRGLFVKTVSVIAKCQTCWLNLQI